MDAIRIWVQAEDPLVRHGLIALLGGRTELEVFPAPEIDSAEPIDASVLLIDGASEATIELIRAFVQRGGFVLALLADAAAAPAALAAGARGLLHRDAPVERMAAAIQALAQGLSVIEPTFLETLGDGAVVREADEWGESLTPREGEVLTLLALGLANKQFGGRLGVIDHTAKFHVNSILGKLGVQSRSEAIVRAARLGLIAI